MESIFMGREALDELFLLMQRLLMVACLMPVLSGCQPEYVDRVQWQSLNADQLRFIENTLPETVDPRSQQVIDAHDVLTIRLNNVKIAHEGEHHMADPIAPMQLKGQRCLFVPVAVEDLAYALAICYDGKRLRLYSGKHVASFVKQSWWKQGMNLGPFLTEAQEGIYSWSIYVKS